MAAGKKRTTGTASKKETPAKQRGTARGAPPKAKLPPTRHSGVTRPVAPLPNEKRCWLLKTEPSVFSFDDLLRAPKRTTGWNGVRNFQARNFMRDQMQVGDLAFIYHSSTDEAGVYGIAEVVRAGYPDPTAFDPSSEYHDPDSTPDAPRWFQVDVRAVRALKRRVLLSELRATPSLSRMRLLQRGNRLSVLPVEPSEWEIICGLSVGARTT